MRLTLLFALVLLVLPGCRRDAPEGVYPCTVASDCPTMWVCRADMRCWSRESVVDAGTDGAIASDGGPPNDTGVDAPMSDTGPHCGAESCNGTDDDCDGLIDEGVMTVGPAVAALSSGGASVGGVLLTATPSGFGAAGGGFASPHVDWVSLDTAGHATSSLDRVDGSIYGALDLMAHDDLVVATGIRDVDGELVAFAAGTPTSRRSSLVFTNAAQDLPLPLIGSFDGTRATVYVLYVDTATGTMHQLWRVRADVTTATGTVLGSVMLTTSIVGGLSVLHTGNTDYVAYVDGAHHLQLAAAPADDGTTAFRPIGTVAFLNTTPTVTGTALGIRDPSAAVSTSNPLAVVWASREGGVYFTEVTDTTTLAMGPARSLPNAQAPARPFFAPIHPLTITTLGADPSHWIVAVMGSTAADMTLAAAQVFELTSIMTREVTVPGEAPSQRAEVSIATSGQTMRLAEIGAGGGIVTRSIGCE